MSNACIIFVLQQTKKAHAHEHQGNTKKNDIMLCADNQWLYSGIQDPRTGEARKDQGTKAVVRFADVFADARSVSSCLQS